MTKELLQQALDEAKADAIEVFTCKDGIAQAAFDAIEYMHSWLGVYFEKQALAQQEPPNPWAEAVIEQLVIHHIYRKEHDADPRKAIRDLFCISNAMVLDPLVSKPAQDLVDRGRKEAQQEQPALSDEEKYILLEKHLGLTKRRDGTVIDRRTGVYTDAQRYFNLITDAIEDHCRGGANK